MTAEELRALLPQGRAGPYSKKTVRIAETAPVVHKYSSRSAEEPEWVQKKHREILSGELFGGAKLWETRERAAPRVPRVYERMEVSEEQKRKFRFEGSSEG